MFNIKKWAINEKISLCMLQILYYRFYNFNTEKKFWVSSECLAPFWGKQEKVASSAQTTMLCVMWLYCHRQN